MEVRAIKRSENDFRFAKVLGEGSFSTVYLAKDVDSGKEFAIKVCDKLFITRNKKQEYIKREKAALLKLHHTPGIIRLIYSFQSQTHLFFVLTYASNGDLMSYIKYMNLESAKFYAAELLLAMEGIHRKKIIHRDLKPQNCLLSSDMHLLVGDFGSVKFLGSENDDDERLAQTEEARQQQRRTSFVGTCLYVSPEILNNKPSQYSSDLFSYGCIVFQLLSGYPPFGTDNESEYRIFQQIKNIDYTFPSNFNVQGKDLIEKLLQVLPEDRLGARDMDTREKLYHSIRRHEFFSGIKFENLYSQRSPMLILSELQNNSSYHISDELETGFGESQIRRILQQELHLSSSSSAVSNSNSLTKILDSRKNHPWAEYINLDGNEFIIKHGFVNKRKGFFARRRMLLLTSTPRLIYIDAGANLKKGEIPFDLTLKCEAKNFKIFFIHTTHRTYNLEDPEGEALKWCKAIEEIRDKYCQA